MIKFARGGDGWKHKEIMYFIGTKARYPHTHFGQFFYDTPNFGGRGIWIPSQFSKSNI
jgi:hypothetical protein